MRIDAHQHFWSVARGDYGWLTSDLDIHRDYAPDDLAPLMARCEVDRTILVQAAPSTAETEYMLGIADATPFVAKVVGWVDAEVESQVRQLERFAKHDKFAGIRPMIQDIPDTEWMHRPDVAWLYDAIVDLGLTFDALGFPVHAAPFLRLFEKYPEMPVVIDHCLKPQIRDDEFDEWAAAMERIATDTGAYCKLSGIVTETAPGWTVETLRPYAEHILSIFGADRVMWGSDWPVLTLESDYEGWCRMAESFVPEADRMRVFGGTAADFYGVSKG